MNNNDKVGEAMAYDWSGGRVKRHRWLKIGATIGGLVLVALVIGQLLPLAA